MKIRNRAIKKAAIKPLQINLNDYTEQELFTALMNKVMQHKDNVCYFVDREYAGSNNYTWKFHNADESCVIESEVRK